MMTRPDFSLIPKVDGVLDDPAMAPVRALCEGPLLTDLVRGAIDALRTAMKEG